jgi:hypothetical protein
MLSVDPQKSEDSLRQVIDTLPTLVCALDLMVLRSS